MAENRHLPVFFGAFSPLAWLLPAVVLVASGCATTPGGADQAAIAGDKAVPEAEAALSLPDIALTPEILYSILVAEIAGHRGRYDISLANYMELAELTRDPRIAERATRIAVYRRQHESAVKAATIWVETAPEVVEAHQILAAVLIRAGRTSESIEHLSFLIDSEPDKVGERFRMIAALLSQEQDKRAAVDAMAQLIERQPTNPDALFAHAHLLLRAGDVEQARELLEQVLELEPDKRSAAVLYLRTLRRLGDIKAAIAWLTGKLRANPGDFEFRMLYARLLVDSHQYDAAQEQFARLTKAKPENAEVLYALGLLQLQASMHEDARQTFGKLITLKKRENLAYYYLAQIDEAEQNAESAIHHYNSIRGGEHFFDAQVRVAVLLTKQGDLDAGRQQLRAIQAHTDEELIAVIRAEAALLSGVKQYAESMLVYAKGLEKHGDSIDLLYGQAMVAVKLGRVDILETNLHKILDDHPDNVLALNALGYTLADQTDRYEEALGYVKKALAQQPNDFFVLDSMGWVLYRLGRYDEAVVYLRRAIEKSDDPEVASHLGEVLWVSGQKAEARDIWDSALKTTPGDERILDAIRRLAR